MADITTANISNNSLISVQELETLSTSVEPLNIRRHDSQTEINNYYINYVDDSLVPSTSKAFKMNENRAAVFINGENSCQLEISHLPEMVDNFLIENST